MVAITELPELASPSLGYSISHQKVELEIDFASKSLQGKTEITIHPHSRDLKIIKLNCRQCTLKRLNIDGKAPTVKYQEPYARFKIHSQASVHQYHQLRQKLSPQLKEPPEEEVILTLPKSLSIRELDPFSAEAQSALIAKVGGLSRRETSDTTITVSTPFPKAADEQGAKFKPITVFVEFSVGNIRDGLQFVGCDDGDPRYTHAYTKNSMFPGSACCLFPCLDDASSRCTWEISIKCPRTLGDVARALHEVSTSSRVNGADGHHGSMVEQDGINGDGVSQLSQEDSALDMSVVCSGDLTDEIVDPSEPSKKTVSFFCTTAVAPQHIGFAVGPFEHVDLSEFREGDVDEKLGQNAIRVHGFCLPGRTEDVKNTCLPMAKAIDYFTLAFGSYPFTSYKLCFLDDMASDTLETMSFSLCSSRLLFPPDIIDPIDKVTRQLVHTLACQWAGVNIIAKEATDTWVVTGIAYFITDLFLKKLCGNNEYRFRHKTRANQLSELDIDRPSLYDLGSVLSIDQSQSEFIALKAPLVLFILDRRLTKASGSSGLARIISRIFLNAKVGDIPNGALSTAQFFRTCEKLGHQKLDAFFQQWVYGAGCPKFNVSQRFNKKKSVVEMLIRQVHGDRVSEQDLNPHTFMRDVKEDMYNVDAGELQPVFTGPMTIRIHEADGTPYEHIVEIKEATTKFEIPYNTKYKRLKRNRRQKERAAAAAGIDVSAEVQDDVLLYCLGDVLQAEEEVRDWRLTDWTKEDEDRMNQESYEWIRMDADFEWIGKMTINMPGYMFLSQLQQDRDVVAQYESVQYIAAQKESALVSTILLRTLMDRRYFHGIRTAAIAGIANCATEELDWIGFFHLDKAFQEMFCFSDSPMTRSNNFSDRTSYMIQCAIPAAMAQIADTNGKTPLRAKQFLLDKLRYNDNTDNELSDCYYIAALMRALAESLVTVKKSDREGGTIGFAFEEDDVDLQRVQQAAIDEIERYRRMDEWINSYHNIFAVTALQCDQKLAKDKIVDPDIREMIQNTREDNFDPLRLQAFETLVETGLLKNDLILKIFLYVLHSDPSPYMRENMQQLFEKGLAAIALGEEEPPPPPPPTEGLVIEQDASLESRQADVARKQTLPGALTALKKELSGNDVLKASLWEAVTAPNISLTHMRDLLDICALLYDPQTSMLVKLDYPRFWRVEHVGQGKLKFIRTDRIRFKMRPKLQWPSTEASSTTVKRENSSGLPTIPKISFKSKQRPSEAASSPPQPRASPANAQPDTGKPKLKLKLKVGKGTG
ncbi:MAG: hypothetical protein M1833_002578 [Piccolia ochrophora]|nr:MAG: hypothetical protein M1833_002578 [Piccolia ochrophora]